MVEVFWIGVRLCADDHQGRTLLQAPANLVPHEYAGRCAVYAAMNNQRDPLVWLTKKHGAAPTLDELLWTPAWIPMIDEVVRLDCEVGTPSISE